MGAASKRSCFSSSYFEALQRERCSISLWSQSGCVPWVPRGPEHHPDKAVVTASIVRLCSLLMDPPLVEVKGYHACFKPAFVGLSLHIARGCGECWGGTAFLLCQNGSSRCSRGFWCCWEEGCWCTTFWCKK